MSTWESRAYLLNIIIECFAREGKMATNHHLNHFSSVGAQWFFVHFY